MVKFRVFLVNLTRKNSKSNVLLYRKKKSTIVDVGKVVNFFVRVCVYVCVCFKQNVARIK